MRKKEVKLRKKEMKGRRRRETRKIGADKLMIAGLLGQFQMAE